MRYIVQLKPESRYYHSDLSSTPLYPCEKPLEHRRCCNSTPSGRGSARNPSRNIYRNDYSRMPWKNISYISGRMRKGDANTRPIKDVASRNHSRNIHENTVLYFSRMPWKLRVRRPGHLVPQSQGALLPRRTLSAGARIVEEGDIILTSISSSNFYTHTHFYLPPKVCTHTH